MPKTKIPEARTYRRSSTSTKQHLHGNQGKFQGDQESGKRAKLQFHSCWFHRLQVQQHLCQCLRVCGNMFVPCGTHLKDGILRTERFLLARPAQIRRTRRITELDDEDGSIWCRKAVCCSGEGEGGRCRENAKGPKGQERTDLRYLFGEEGLLGNDSKLRTAKLNEKIQELENLIFQETNLSCKLWSRTPDIDKSKVRALEERWWSSKA